MAARVGGNIEALLFGGQLDARGFVHPSTDFSEDALQERLIEMRRIAQREIDSLLVNAADAICL